MDNSLPTKINEPLFRPNDLRKTILDMAFNGSTVHIACAFSIVEIVAVLYRSFLKNLSTPFDKSRDYLVLSKGHGVMALYACFYELGWLKDGDIQNYFKDGTLLKGLSDAHVPGLEVTSGSLGHGLSVGVGLALAAKLKKTGQTIYAIVGDGEMNEGTMWEALLFAAHWKLSNLVVIVDENGFQAMGSTDEVMSLTDLQMKFDSFGFETYSVDGHSEVALNEIFDKISASSKSCPKAVIAKTIKGKGVSFMEANNIWHYTRLDEKTYLDAIKELCL